MPADLLERMRLKSALCGVVARVKPPENTIKAVGNGALELTDAQMMIEWKAAVLQVEKGMKYGHQKAD